MKIFVDVGSHFGETLDEVRKDKYGFDKIYSIIWKQQDKKFW